MLCNTLQWDRVVLPTPGLVKRCSISITCEMERNAIALPLNWRLFITIPRVIIELMRMIIEFTIPFIRIVFLR